MNRLFSYLILIISLVGFNHNACAGPIFYRASLDGPSEAPPNTSPGTGYAGFWLDKDAQTLYMDVTFSDLVGTVTAAHIHAATAAPGTGTAGVATQVPTFTGFPLGVTSGSYSHTFDTTLASTFNPAYVTANGGTVALAEAALFSAIENGRAYLNIHSTFRTGGEIRGFLQVPEPAMNSFMALGVLGFAFAKRRAVSLTT